MRTPVKLNRASLPRWARALPGTVDDPRPLLDADALDGPTFARCVSLLQFGATRKTTHAGRLPRSTAWIAAACRAERPVLADVGASDGSTSLDLADALGDDFSELWVTDRNPYVRVGADARGHVFFRAPDGACVMRADPRIVVYAEAASHRPGFRRLAERVRSQAEAVTAWREVLLVQPALRERMRADPRVRFRAYDAFAPWDGPPLDGIRVANLFNRAYFDDARLADGIAIQARNLRDGGFLALVDSRGAEDRFTALRRRGSRLEVVAAEGGGAESAPFAPERV